MSSLGGSDFEGSREGGEVLDHPHGQLRGRDQERGRRDLRLRLRKEGHSSKENLEIIYFFKYQCFFKKIIKK